LLCLILAKADGPTSFHGLFSGVGGSSSSTTEISHHPTHAPPTHTPLLSGDTAADKHKLKKKKKKNRHKHKHKHKHERHEKERSRDRERMGGDRMGGDRMGGDRMGVASPMVPSVQSVTSMSSNTRDSAPSSPEFEVI